MIFKWKYQNKFDQLNTNIDAINNIEIKCKEGENFPFVQKFSITIFKLFIILKYDYCSSLFIYFSNNNNCKRLDKNYVKALKSYLNIKIMYLEIDNQFNILKDFKLLPLKLRIFQNITFFIFSLQCRNAIN
jgi:hypothetical protein